MDNVIMVKFSDIPNGAYFIMEFYNAAVFQKISNEEIVSLTTPNPYKDCILTPTERFKERTSLKILKPQNGTTDIIHNIKH